MFLSIVTALIALGPAAHSAHGRDLAPCLLYTGRTSAQRKQVGFSSRPTKIFITPTQGQAVSHRVPRLIIGLRVWKPSGSVGLF
ncbi:hypothetical protein RRG08_029328 [Elysia crispata]|uniref:Secreted protein n=1 Tax=Elysia crispata TaxID=231223 RepID=A0AAE1E420_9GAST|nr:hypothetical protein RRG08_029328 [Elysia crispata]